MEIMSLRQKVIDEEMRVAQKERLAEEEKVRQRRMKEKEKVHSSHTLLSFFIKCCPLMCKPANNQ